MRLRTFFSAGKKLREMKSVARLLARGGAEQFRPLRRLAAKRKLHCILSKAEGNSIAPGRVTILTGRT